MRAGQQRPDGIAAVIRDDTARRDELRALKNRLAELESQGDG
jgi:hypothetical protein